MLTMVLYAHAFNGNTHDRIELTVIGPDGNVFDHTATLDLDQAQSMRAYGRRAPSQGWSKGDYRGYARLIRGNTILAVRHADITVE